MVLQALAFYVFAAVAVASGIMVVTARNPVHSVLFLILAFFNAAGLFVLMGAEFLAMILVIVYVGAVAVLFLFVVMMLNIDFVELRQGFVKYLPIGGLIGAVLIFDIYALYQQFALKRLRSHLETEILTNLELQEQAERFHQLSTTDPLTGLSNRRFVTEQLRHEVSRAHRYARQLAVVLFDLDNFKQINDLYGHLAGDEVMRQFAALLQEKTRSSDTPARYGGDEFLVVLPETKEAQAQRFLNRVGRSVEVSAGGRKIQVGISAGRAGYTEGDSVETLLERADQSLYACKRNR